MVIFFRTFSLFLAPNILKIFSTGVAQFLECEGEEKHCTAKLRKKQKTWGGLPEDLGGGVRRVSGNPYPISDQNM